MLRYGHRAAFGAGNAASAGLGFGLGLFLFPYMYQALTSSRVIVKTVIICQNCGGKNPENFKFCGQCGRALYPPLQIQCPKCGINVPSMNFCGNCGFRLKQ